MNLKGEIIELDLNEVQAFDEDTIAAYSYAAVDARNSIKRRSTYHGRFKI